MELTLCFASSWQITHSLTHSHSKTLKQSDFIATQETAGDLETGDSTTTVDCVQLLQHDPVRAECPVCLHHYQVGDVVVRSDACRHVFCESCLWKWLSTGRTVCPLCRRGFVPENEKEDES